MNKYFPYSESLKNYLITHKQINEPILPPIISFEPVHLNEFKPVSGKIKINSNK